MDSHPENKEKGKQLAPIEVSQAINSRSETTQQEVENQDC
jgi:hypothetical protein